MIKVEHTKIHTIQQPEYKTMVGGIIKTKSVLVTDVKLVLVETYSGGGKWIEVNGRLKKPILISETEKIEVGDWVYIKETTGYSFIGKLTKLWVEEPYCEIDGKGYDLATEGHTSQVFKILALPEHFSPQQLQMIVDGKLKDGDKVLVETQHSKGGEKDWYGHQIKLNPHITIYPVEEKMYTMDEMLDNIVTFNLSTLYTSVEEAKKELPKLFESKRKAAKEWFEQNVK